MGALILGVIALVVAGVGEHSVIALAAAGVLLDLAVQSHQILSQRDIYALAPDARARLNTVFMTSIFVGGAVCSVVAGLLEGAYGWTGVTVFGGLLPLLAVGVWWRGRRLDPSA